MNPWAWYRQRGIIVKILIGAPAGIVLFALGYVGVQAVRYNADTVPPETYLPAEVDVRVKIDDLEGHWTRIKGTAAWRVIEKKILGDPSLRRVLNEALDGAGLPTLDDLEDPRKMRAFSEENLMRGAGRGVAAGLRADAAGERFVAVTRLRFMDFLATPLAPLVLEEGRIPGADPPVMLAIRGSLAVVSNDAAMLEEAMAGRGPRIDSDAPVHARVEFERSNRLRVIRAEADGFGLTPYLQAETAKAWEVTMDVGETTVHVEAMLEGAIPARDREPPVGLLAFAPYTSSGYFVTSAGVQEILAWIDETATFARPALILQDQAMGAKAFLDRTGFREKVMPWIGSGLVFATGREDVDGQMFPGAAVLLPSADPARALGAIESIILPNAPAEAEGTFREVTQVGGVEVISWRWPDALGYNAFARFCYAQVPGGLVVGNNKAFTESVVRTAAGEQGPLTDESSHRMAWTRLEKFGHPPGGSAAVGFFFPRQVRESLDGLVPLLAARVVGRRVNPAKLRAEIDREFRERGMRPTQEEIVERFNEEIDRRRAEAERSLRASLRALHTVNLAAFRAHREQAGVRLRLLLELR